MEISTRLTVLRVLLIIFIALSLFIVGVDYYVLDNVLIKSAENSLSLAAEKTSEHIYEFLRPIETRTTIGTSLIQNGNITPNFSPLFVNFLHAITANDPSVSICFFADANGDFYSLQKNNNKYININLLHEDKNMKEIENTFDERMNLISSKTTSNINYDPRITMWYQQAVYKKSKTWYISLQGAINKLQTKLEDASIAPVYDKLGTLRGVFGVGTLLKELGESIKNVTVYPESVVLVIDDKGLVMAAYTAKQDLIGLERMPSITELHLPWIEQALTEYQLNKQAKFIYNYNNQKYLAIFSAVPQMTIEQKWYVTIITPVSSVILPSKINMLLLLVVAIGVLIVIVISAKLMSSE